jgi:hypothetical protein
VKKKKQMNKLIKLTMNPWFVTGFTDAEGCFSLSIIKNKELKTGWEVKIRFEIHLHKKDIDLLKRIKGFFNVGEIYDDEKESCNYMVRSVKDLAVIIDHFDKYPLITQKQADYILFKQALELINRKEHLTSEGLQKIVNIRASMNNGLTEVLTESFLNTTSIPRPLVLNSEIKDPNWLAGFTVGEGCFYVKISKSKTKLGEAVQLIFQITQHTRDELLLFNFKNYLGCGKYYAITGKDFGDFRVSRISDITEKIIPFFTKYCLQGAKSKDFEDFCKVVYLMEKKAHLTLQNKVLRKKLEK